MLKLRAFVRLPAKSSVACYYGLPFASSLQSNRLYSIEDIVDYVDLLFPILLIIFEIADVDTPC